MTLRLLVTLLLVGAFAGTAAAMCDGMHVVKKPTVVASTDGSATPPVKRPVTPQAD